ncbi:MAG: (2Fe-2S)-binding protein, partial [Phycisphaerales bacterium]
MTSPATITVHMTLNGQQVTVDVPPFERLLDTLRDRLALTGTKEGCGEGECGACTVHLDGLPANACLVPTYQCRGREIRTVESIPAESLQPMLEAGATQCGACTPGVVMTADWIRRNPDLLATQSPRELMAGNLCRCTGYDGIIDGLTRALANDRASE